MSTIRPRLERLVEFLTIAMATAPALIDQASTDSTETAWWALSGYIAVAVGTLAVRKRFPLASFGTMLVSLGAAEIWAATQEAQLTNLAVLPLAFSIYAVGSCCLLRTAVFTLGGAASVIGAGVLVNHATASTDWRGGSDVIATVAPLPVAWALGVVARSHQMTLTVAQQQAAESQWERQRLAEQAVVAERGRIARDMHDVVAHSLTLLVVHAETIRARSDGLPPWAREQIDALAAAGRQATVEMRELLGVLREGAAEEAPRAPAPTLDDVESLVEAARAAGNQVAVSLSGDFSAVPKPVQLTGYRVLQESLTNARRHAPGADVHVQVDADDEVLRMEIVSARSPRRATAVPGDGIGLIGMKERVTALGGRFSAGPTHEGFRVGATVPIARASGKGGRRGGW